MLALIHKPCVRALWNMGWGEGPTGQVSSLASFLAVKHAVRFAGFIKQAQSIHTKSIKTILLALYYFHMS